ncbi:PRC-barrel domain containing protein [Salinimonas marina]|uniref:PRC-barrel domain containing protein n=1 Tax=Salinimonas marina TaxID=2785918 RepID=A0A7S9DZF2_9ALTE|nr:PRC-barrel domain containing protein [Salinimonas marina]QPG06749.1 PRC-barrel domain containing protein [Salinimonas marina]
MISHKQMKQYSIHATDGDIGGCKDILFDDQDFVARYLVADTNSWLPLSRKVVISPIAVTKVNTEEQWLSINMSSQSIKEGPSIDEHKPVSREYEETLFKYFGYGYYWIGPGAWGDFSHPTQLVDQDLEREVEQAPAQPTNHLRSCNEVHGYDVETLNDDVGHITDFIFDNDGWTLQLFIIDTHNWLPGGKKLAVRPADVKNIDWSSHKVQVNLSHDALMQKPEIDMDRLADAAYLEAILAKA